MYEAVGLVCSRSAYNHRMTIHAPSASILRRWHFLVAHSRRRTGRVAYAAPWRAAGGRAQPGRDRQAPACSKKHCRSDPSCPDQNLTDSRESGYPRHFDQSSADYCLQGFFSFRIHSSMSLSYNHGLAVPFSSVTNVPSDAGPYGVAELRQCTAAVSAQPCHRHV